MSFQTHSGLLALVAVGGYLWLYTLRKDAARQTSIAAGQAEPGQGSSPYERS